MLLLVFSVLNHAASAATVSIGNNDRYALSPAFSFYEDRDALLTLDDVLQPRIQQQFREVGPGASATNFGLTRSAIWLRVQLHTESATPPRWMLEVANPSLDRLDLYVSKPEGGYEHQTGGDTLPFAQRSIAHRNHVKPLNLAADSDTVVYLRVRSEGTVSVPATLWQPTPLWQSDQKTYSLFSLYFGQLLGLVFYNLMLFLSVRDRAYLLYVLLAGSIGMSQVANSGLGAQFLWPNSLWLNDIAANCAYAASGTFGLLFVRNFLASRTQMPRLDRLLRMTTLLWAASFVLALFLPHYLIVWLESGLALLGAVLVVMAGAISIRQQHPGAKYFAIAWLALLLAVLIVTAHSHGLLPSNLFTTNALLFGSALEMVLLSFALADRINVARREKEAALKRVLSEQAMVQALQQSQQRYRAVIEHVGEGMVVLQNERVVFANARAAEILNASKTQIMEEGLLSRIHAEDQPALLQRMHSRLQGHAVPERLQLCLKLPDHTVKWLEWGDNPVPWDGGQGLLVFFLDVTQRYNAELETRAAIEHQQRLNDLRSRFIAMTSHEFRTPLATILSAQDLLQTYGDRIPSFEKIELFDMIRLGVNRMTRMLERILLLGQAEAHMLECKPQPIDLEALCRDMIAEAQKQQPDSECALALHCTSTGSGRLFDENLLRHIFGNLLSNAIKYSPVGGEVRMDVFSQGQDTVFKVTDQGIGIPAAEMGDLFESFHRASNVGGIAGTGLGLAIVKQSVELHGGSIAVDSREGHGTCFTVHIRHAADAAESHSTVAATP